VAYGLNVKIMGFILMFNKLNGVEMNYRYFEHDGTQYRITLIKGEDWRDCSKDTLERFNPELKQWFSSVTSVDFIRFFGTPVNHEG